MTAELFVPSEFVVPLRLETPQFVLEPLGPQHNDADYEAWSSSMEHIHGTPGWEDSSWPRSMTPDENRADLERHAADFEGRTGFTYTVLSPEGAVIGCVYIYPAPDEAVGARVLSWVRASEAELDVPLWRAVSEWIESDWPFERVEYPARDWSIRANNVRPHPTLANESRSGFTSNRCSSHSPCRCSNCRSAPFDRRTARTPGRPRTH